MSRGASSAVASKLFRGLPEASRLSRRRSMGVLELPELPRPLVAVLVVRDAEAEEADAAGVIAAGGLGLAAWKREKISSKASPHRRGSALVLSASGQKSVGVDG